MCLSYARMLLENKIKKKANKTTRTQIFLISTDHMVFLDYNTEQSMWDNTIKVGPGSTGFVILICLLLPPHENSWEMVWQMLFIYFLNYSGQVSLNSVHILLFVTANTRIYF